MKLVFERVFEQEERIKFASSCVDFSSPLKLEILPSNCKFFTAKMEAMERIAARQIANLECVLSSSKMRIESFSKIDFFDFL